MVEGALRMVERQSVNEDRCVVIGPRLRSFGVAERKIVEEESCNTAVESVWESFW